MVADGVQATHLATLVAQAVIATSSRTFHLVPSPFVIAEGAAIKLPANSSDPGSLLATSGLGSITSLLAAADPIVIARLVPHLPAIAKLPVVLHIVTSADHTPVVALLRSAGLTSIYSSDASQAQINALVAGRIAQATKKGVIHWFEDSNSDGKLFSAHALTVAKKFVGGEGTMSAAKGTSNDRANSRELTEEVLAAFAGVPNSLGHAQPYTYVGAEKPTSLVIVVGSAPSIAALGDALPRGGGLLALSLYRPLRLDSLVPDTVKTIAVVEQAYTRTTRWGPLFLDVLTAFGEIGAPRVVGRTLGAVSTADDAIATLAEALAPGASVEGPPIGDVVPLLLSDPVPAVVRIPRHEQAYTKMLEQLFGPRLDIVNAPDRPASFSSSSPFPQMMPEAALGRVLAASAGRNELKRAVKALLADLSNSSLLDPEIARALEQWLQKPRDQSIALNVVAQLPKLRADDNRAAAVTIMRLSAHFAHPSLWIVGSDAWSYDLGSSGVHHTLSSGADVNLLIIDSEPYGGPEAAADPERRRKKDIGLYAMNYGGSYVASVAVYGDYSQVARALVEADRFDGPSIVLAYLPGGDRDDAKALDVLKETKRAIDVGYWPLYRWDPSRETRASWNPTDDTDAFQLDSERIKADMRAFVDRHNQLTQIASSKPVLADSIVSSHGARLRDARERAARAAFEKLSGAVNGPPLVILYASDGGNAEKVAKRLMLRARTRGLGARVATMDDFATDDLALEPNVVFITSTAGQGEFPQNGRSFWKSLQAFATNARTPAGGERRNFDQVRFSVFAMGDSHYWPRPEDAQYYNKSGKDLDRRFGDLGAERVVNIGLGDDHDADGWQTGYKAWEPLLWKALGVGDIEVDDTEAEPVTNEHIKIASNFLRGTIAEGLVDTSTGALAESDGQLTKFHGIYQQDDRDIRDDRKASGLEPAYSFMVRLRLPAGVCRPEQWLQVDRISDTHGNGTFKLTTRQTFQFHGIIKRNLKPAIQEINKALLDTIAACGDVNRNVMCTAVPSIGPLHVRVYAFAKSLSEHLMPHTSAYAEIWLDKKMVAGDAVRDFEPLYGPYYLPRKFKIAIAVPPTNDVDVFCNDVGFIAIVDPTSGDLLGFNVSIGGGMGVTHSMKSTYPRLGDVIGFVKPEEGNVVAEKIMLVQRDNGDRTNRKHARLKYTIDDMGLENFKAEVEKRLGRQLEPAREYEFDRNIDDFGWIEGCDGRWHFTSFIENGRVVDEPGKQFKTGLREIAQVHEGVFRLTGNQHLIISDVPPHQKATIARLLSKYHLDNLEHTGLRLSSSACVAFPTCGLAMAESERYLPVLIDKVEKICEESGLRHDSIVMRMTGCPNGCARPYVAEVGFVGKAPGSYVMLLGGGYYGQRLNKIYKETVNEDEILEILGSMIKAYASKRLEGERFGDFCIRQGYISATTSGKTWYEDMAPES